VEARFTKAYPPPTSVLSMVGVLTRDEREHIHNCQVLIMQPNCAEMVLLASEHGALLPRIRYVIFDEVHNIVSKDGDVWEHLLSFIEAPFVALSATVGNPEQFGEWLCKLEQVRSSPFSCCGYCSARSAGGMV
jgi:superfamily II RNA helicase